MGKTAIKFPEPKNNVIQFPLPKPKKFGNKMTQIFIEPQGKQYYVLYIAKTGLYYNAHWCGCDFERESFIFTDKSGNDVEVFRNDIEILGIYTNNQ